MICLLLNSVIRHFAGIRQWVWLMVRPRGLEITLYPRIGRLAKAGRVPRGRLVLIDQQCPNALLEIALYPALQGYDVFDAEHIGQRHQAHLVQKGKRQARGTGGASGKCACRPLQPWVVVIGPCLNGGANLVEISAAACSSNDVKMTLQWPGLRCGAGRFRLKKAAKQRIVTVGTRRPTGRLDVGQQSVETIGGELVVGQTKQQAI